MKVEIEATQEVKLWCSVEMSQEDFDLYTEIIESDSNCAQKDEMIRRIADKYGYQECENQQDWERPEEVAFSLVNP